MYPRYSPSAAPRSAVVVGAGMVGLACAWHLQEQGVEVTVLDRSGVAAGASWGNAGWLTPGMAMPLADPALCLHLMEDAGFVAARVISEALDYYHTDAEARWREITASLEGVPLSKLPPEERALIKVEHAADLEAVTTPEGIRAAVPANFVFGSRP